MLHHPLLKNVLLYGTGLFALTLTGLAQAGSEPDTLFAHPDRIGLHWVDWGIIAIYLAAVLGLGWSYSRMESDTKEYFIAAKKHLNPTLIGISVFATLLSTVSYLSKPGEMINKGPMFMIAGLFAAPVAYYVVGYFLIPYLMRFRVTSAYELLEAKLGLSTRVLGACIFISLRLIWMGLLIHLSSIALVVIFAMDPKWIPLISALVGLVAVVYTSLGGLRTVVITDLIQFCLLLFGALVTIGIVTYKMGGFGWFPTEWAPEWDHQPWFTLDPTVRVSVTGAFISLVFWQVATAGSDQTAVQRYMATRDASTARHAYLISICANVTVSIILAVLGMALLGFFSAYPGAMAPGTTLEADGDFMFPYFIANFLPIGVSGLVVSAAIAAAMSSVDSGVNSITAVVMSDFLDRFGWKFKSEKGHVLFSKGTAFCIGTLVVCMSMFVQHVPGNFTEMATKTANLLVSPLFALFILALWVPFSTPLGAFLGFAYGFSAAILIGFWEPLTGLTQLSFQWVGPGAMVVNLLVALPVSKWGPGRNQHRKVQLAGAIGALLLAGFWFWLLA